MSASPYQNRVRQALASGRFVLTVEVTLPSAHASSEDALRPILTLAREVRGDPRIDGLAFTDRSHSDHDYDPITSAARAADVCGTMPIVHWAGKDRTLSHLEADLDRAARAGLDTFLLVTGDKLRHPPVDRPVRYLDSVTAIHAARQRFAELLLAGAVCPFKYCEEDLLGQYFKAAKKLRAGGNFLMTQIGWDSPKFAEVAWFLNRRGYRAPLVAELLFLTAARGRRIRRTGLPGVTVTDQLVARLEEEAESPDGGRAAAYRRLALQVGLVRDLGYAGVQVSGLVRYDSIVRLFDEMDTVMRVYPTSDARREAAERMLTLRDGRTAEVAPANGFYLDAEAPANREQGTGTGEHQQVRWEWTRYRALDLTDRVLFREGSIGARILGPVVRRIDPDSTAGRALVVAERAIKAPLVGCQTCGFCRLPQTAYVCPETCPKGLANGPCGGTTNNRCEFGDRECIHNEIYRISKRAGMLPRLEDMLIPPVPVQAWGTCSWITEFRGAGPRTTRLKRQ
ncbi:MAG TPA: methylenetetrahydrofolate reductase C-terminal domain-containing protein [bacterium]